MGKILITGATGTIGQQAVKALRERGEAVRAAVRSPEKARALGELGAELTRFDFLDAATYEAALAGVDRVLLVSPFVEDFVPAVQRFVTAAAAAGVRFILRLSALGADPSAPLAVGRKHGLADQVLRDSGVPWAVIQPTFFMDNFFKFHAETIRHQGAFYGASGAQPVSYISSRDIAEVAAEILRAPAKHASQTYVLTGPEALRDDDIAGRIAQQLGRAVSYVDVTPEQLSQGAQAQGSPAWLAEALAGLENVKRQGWASAISPAVQQLLGREGERFDAFLTRNQARF